MRNFWKKYHKWAGLLFSFFILMFCFSGIVLNHRSLFSSIEVSRSWMPRSYHYKNWNNGIIKGTLRLPDGKILVYGNAGVWQTDSCFVTFTGFNHGLLQGIDNRKISNILCIAGRDIWCAGLYSIYLLDKNQWKEYPIPGNEERISDIAQRGDTLVALTRSNLYSAVFPYREFKKTELKVPENYSSEVSLFRTIWLIHSGELFGTPGKLAVDFLGVVLIILSLTGILYFSLPSFIRRRNRRRLPVKAQAKALVTTLKWHNKLGVWLVVFTLLLSVTGMCLRPPLMIPLVLAKTQPIPGTTLDSDNPWHDKLRSIRWDTSRNAWLLSSSMGFYLINDFALPPIRLKRTPPVSPMGVNVFYPESSGEWLIGSFSGLFIWNPSTGIVIDYYTGKPPQATHGRPIGSSLVNGFTDDLVAREVIFEYDNGARNKENTLELPVMPDFMEQQPMSLWNFCLELHVGRCYSPFLGVFSDLFVFISGLLLTFILLSGYIVYRRHHKHIKKNKSVVPITENE